MDLVRLEVFAFVFRPLNGAEAYLRGFTGDCKDTSGCTAAEKSIRGNLRVGNFLTVGSYSCLVSTVLRLEFLSKHKHLQ